MSEKIFSFYNCAPVPQGPQITVLSDLSDLSDRSDSVAGYTILRNFRGWLTVTAAKFRRRVAVLFRRFPRVKMPYRPCVLACAGGLRL